MRVAQRKSSNSLLISYRPRRFARGHKCQASAVQSSAAYQAEHIEGAHIVDTVCHFDQNHAYVFRHGKNHFAEIFSLSLLMARAGNFAYFSNAID